ncbi:hypothetical protein, partial [Rhodopirellula baltica]|uniref:hypothetical protein n=1 Tax=Rhodopirellula baltica TaxID=265606 RepID=UPI00055BCE6E
MNNFLTKSADLLDSAKNLVQTFGGYLVSQSESSSEAYARHQLRLAHVHAAKELMTEEAKSVAGVRDSLRQRFLDADPESRLQIRRDLASTEAELQRLAVYSKGADYLPEFANKIRFVDEGDDQSQAIDDDAGTTDHWIDRFNELARIRLEPWRQDLLARALAAEATAPGIVTLRALWAIGLLDQTKFQAFSILLDLCSVIAGG